MDIDTDIVILGAGLSGLAAAEILSSAGKRVLLLEKECFTGGLARTVIYKDFKFDLGGHRLYFKDAALAARVEKLLEPEPLLRLRRRSSTFIGGRFLRYPPTLLNGLLYAAPALIKRMRRTGSKPTEGSLKDWLHARFGPGIHDAYFRDYTLKVWGLPTDLISAAWAETRIGPLNLKKLFFEMLSAKSASKENALDFLYPRGGIGGLCSALQKKLPPRAQVLTGAVPLKFETVNGRINSVLFELNGQHRRTSCRHVISTIPLTGLAPMFKEDPGPAAFSGGVKYRSLIVLFASMKRKAPLRDHWIYFPEKEIFFSRACELSNWSPAMAGTDGTLPITFEIFCDEGDRTWRMKDEDLIKKTEHSLRAIKLFGDFKTVDFTAVRMPHAYPLLYSGFEKPLENLKAALAGYQNLELCGRTGAHAYLDMEECLKNAEAAAVRILAKKA